MIKAVAGQPTPLESTGTVADVPFLDDTELDFADEEGRRILRHHLIRERSARLVQMFKAQLKDCSCRVCGFDFLKAYGELGRGYIEAHHTKPVATMNPGEVAHIQDLVPVCSNCHRMLHRKYPTIDWKSLKDLMAKVFADRH